MLANKRQLVDSQMTARMGNSSSTKVLTFLTLVEHWRTRMIHTIFLRVGEGLSTSLVDTLAGHTEERVTNQIYLEKGEVEEVLRRELYWHAA